MTLGNENDTNGVEAAVACMGEVGRVRVKGKDNACQASTKSSAVQQPLTGREQRQGSSAPTSIWVSQQPLIHGGVGTLRGNNDSDLGPGLNHHEEDLSSGARPREYNGATAATTGYELKNLDLIEKI